MPLYGSQLCDISCTAIAKFYTAWRKAIRYMLNLPRRTHCDLLHLICNDVSIHNQMSKRFVHFFKQIYKSDNSITSFCSRLAFAGSQSSVGNSLIYVSNMLKCSKYDTINCKCKSSVDDDHITNQIKASIIRELLDIAQVKHGGCQSIFSNDEMQLIIIELCTM